MDIKNLNPKNYKSLFRYEGKITALHSEFFVRGSHGECDPLVVNSNDVWNTFLNKKTERFCQDHNQENTVWFRRQGSRSSERAFLKCRHALP